MSGPQADLSVLSRDSSAAAATSTNVSIPYPPVRWKTRVLLPAAILSAAGGLLAYSARDALSPAVDVRVVPVVQKQGPSEGSASASTATAVQAAGWVEAEPYAIAVTALADGVVREVLVLEGERVEAGAVVVRLIDDDARIAARQAQADVDQREAMRKAAEATRLAAQREWDHPVELTRRVARAEAELLEAMADLERWPALVAVEEARMRELESEYARVRSLADKQQASEIELVRAREQYEAQKATAEATRLRKPMIQAAIDARRAERDAARENLALRIAETKTLDESLAALSQAEAMLARARATLDEAQLRLARMEVRSPSAGVVMSRLVEPGSKVMLAADDPRSAQVLRLYDPARLQVRVDVPLADAAQIGVGQEAEIVVGVLPDRMFRGRVTRVAHEADVTRNTLQVKVALLDPSPQLRPEMLARVRIFASAQPAGGAAAPGVGESLFAPRGLVQRTAGDESYVWVIDPSGDVARRRIVTPGMRRIDDWIEIAAGLHPGDRLIVDAPPGLRDGQRVRVVGEAPSPPASGGSLHAAH